MKNIFSEDNTKEDIDGIKSDIESLAQRLASLKDHSVENLAVNIENLATVISNLKDKGINMGRDKLAYLSSSTRQHPLRNLIWAFGIGIIACCLFNKRR